MIIGKTNPTLPFGFTIVVSRILNDLVGLRTIMKDLETQLHCLKPTWILTGVSILKFSLDGALNVKQYDLNAPVKFFKRSEIQQMKDFYIDKTVPGKTPIALLYNIGSITSRCIFISLMMYYIKECCRTHESCDMTNVA